MNQFNLNNFLNNFKRLPNIHQKNDSTALAKEPSSSEVNLKPPNLDSAAQKSIINQGKEVLSSGMYNYPNHVGVKMRGLNSTQRASHIKDLMNLPKELDELLQMIQNKTVQVELPTKAKQKDININDLVQLMQQGSKEATNKMIIAMSNASKQGITDLSQIKETLKLINSTVSGSSQDNPSQSLKNFMLLYLPWLPLQEGVDFELEIDFNEGANGKSETSITILISTKNFGNVKFTLVLSGMNSINLVVDCCEGFPKEELLKKIKLESKSHSIQPNVMFEESIKRAIDASEPASTQAKISMSNMTEVNPFLLLMANFVIRLTIELDNEVSGG